VGSYWSGAAIEAKARLQEGRRRRRREED